MCRPRASPSQIAYHAHFRRKAGECDDIGRHNVPKHVRSYAGRNAAGAGREVSLEPTPLLAEAQAHFPAGHGAGGLFDAR